MPSAPATSTVACQIATLRSRWNPLKNAARPSVVKNSSHGGIGHRCEMRRTSKPMTTMITSAATMPMSVSVTWIPTRRSGTTTTTTGAGPQ